MASIEKHVQTVQILIEPNSADYDELRIITVMSSNVDDLLYGYLPEGAEAVNFVLQQFLVERNVRQHSTHHSDPDHVEFTE